ncbi:MAG: ATP phosphoribosyltransferase [Alphaproteobacteria bacterium]|nr:ATP phosphoribosyltransferase [Alphaproteobacteria bacterium]
MSMADILTLAVPKGRILKELTPVLSRAGIEPEDAFYDDSSRQLMFATRHPSLRIIRVRSFDVATFTAFGAAQLGIAGSDVIEEFSYPELYAPVDLKIGQCRLSVAVKDEDQAHDNPARWSHIRVATKYPRLTQRHFARRGVQTECIELSGAMELAPVLGLSRRIVDLVSSGATLKANGLTEIEKIMEVSSRLIVSRQAMKTHPQDMQDWINRFQLAAV